MPADPPIPSDGCGPALAEPRAFAEPPAFAEPRIFAEPWEAQAFAMVVSLYRAGYFTWPEWVATISAEIREAQARGDPDLGGTYYGHWLAALETIMVAKGLATSSELRLRRLECEANAVAQHTHPARREPVHVG